MATFEKRSYQTDNDKWVPFGIVHLEVGGDVSEELVVDYKPLYGKTFDTKEAADEFFLKYCAEGKYKSVLK